MAIRGMILSGGYLPPNLITGDPDPGLGTAHVDAGRCAHIATDTTLFLTMAYGAATGKTAGVDKKSVTLLRANGTYLHNGNDGKHS
jgi:hypothetical protein